MMMDSKPQFGGNANPYAPIKDDDHDPAVRRPGSIATIRPFELMSRSIALMGEQYMLFVGMSLLAMLIGSAIPFGLGYGPMMIGMFFCFEERERQRHTELGTLFRGFDHFLEAIVATLLYGLISLVILGGAGILVGTAMFFTSILDADGPSVATPILFISALLIMPLLQIAIALPYTFVFSVIADQQVSGWDAIKSSFQGAMNNAFGLIGFYLVSAVAWVLALATCVVPVFFFLPVYLGAVHLLYRDIYGFGRQHQDRANEAGGIGQSPFEGQGFGVEKSPFAD